jgi:asparagine synthase (glutamine-hydrolysing)
VWKSYAQIASDLGPLLDEEILAVSEGRKEIYLLLSGGLDSRIVGGVLARLRNEGKLDARLVGVTWGLEDSRDVVYGRKVAEILSFEWIHVNMSCNDLIHGVETTAIDMGLLTSPVHLHCMHWFKNVSNDVLVLAASYGDSVGRAVFSGRHVLELAPLRPTNMFGLMRREVLASAYSGLMEDNSALHDRSPGQPRYVLCEHAMQGHYMRNMIGQAMSVIGQYCPIYQAFTDPKVYSYMWSIHPSLRTDGVYGELLEQLNPGLARLPWARTNRALRGATVGSQSGLRKNFHEYASWISGPLFERLRRYIDPDWFAETGIFDAGAIRDLEEYIRNGNQSFGFAPYERWVWLAGFCRLAQRLEAMGKSVNLDISAITAGEPVSVPLPVGKSVLARRVLCRPAFMQNLLRQGSELVRGIRRRILSYRSIRDYPPERSS